MGIWRRGRNQRASLWTVARRLVLPVGRAVVSTAGAVALLCRTSPVGTLPRPPSAAGGSSSVSWTGRAGPGRPCENKRGASVKEEDAWRCRWQLQLCWIAQSIRGGGVGGQDGYTPLPRAPRRAGDVDGLCAFLFLRFFSFIFPFSSLENSRSICIFVGKILQEYFSVTAVTVTPVTIHFYGKV